MTKRVNIAIRIASLFFIFVSQHIVLAQEDNYLLWKIESPDRAPSYLLGTIHLDIDCIYDKYPQIHGLIDTCKQLALEIIPDENMAMTLLPLIMAESGKELEDYMSKKDYNKLKKALKKNLDVDITSFKQYKPIAIFFIIQMMNKAENESDNTNTILDFQLMHYATENGKKLISIETIQEQIQALSTMPVKVMIDQLKQPDKSAEIEALLLNAYCEGDLNTINKLINETGDVMMLDEFLDKRNIIMAERMKVICEEDSTFFAVGAGHLTGKNGIVSLLTQKGFTLVPVK